MRPVTFVIPCLNERATLALALQELQRFRAQVPECEVIVVDNDSCDGSAEVAAAYADRVLHCSTRGYGAALRLGIEAAKHEIVIYADADSTYDLSEAGLLLAELCREEADLVVGNRLRGKIEPGAMPALHRWIGTPTLSFVINVLHARKRRILIGDCNSGFRALRRSSYRKWQVNSRGMEFASELIVQAIRYGGRYCEVPISYRRPQVPRRSNLRPWRDGWRHLRLIMRASYIMLVCVLLHGRADACAFLERFGAVHLDAGKAAAVHEIIEHGASKNLDLPFVKNSDCLIGPDGFLPRIFLIRELKVNEQTVPIIVGLAKQLEAPKGSLAKLQVLAGGNIAQIGVGQVAPTSFVPSSRVATFFAEDGFAQAVESKWVIADLPRSLQKSLQEGGLDPYKNLLKPPQVWGQSATQIMKTLRQKGWQPAKDELLIVSARSSDIQAYQLVRELSRLGARQLAWWRPHQSFFTPRRVLGMVRPPRTREISRKQAVAMLNRGIKGYSLAIAPELARFRPADIPWEYIDDSWLSAKAQQFLVRWQDPEFFYPMEGDGPLPAGPDFPARLQTIMKSVDVVEDHLPRSKVTSIIFFQENFADPRGPLVVSKLRTLGYKVLVVKSELEF